MSEEFNLLGLNKNTTLEDIQISFAYLYQMIDLIYPLEKNGSTGKDRSNELKRLEIAYLSALKNIRKEIITVSDIKKVDEPIIELNKIEILLSKKNLTYNQSISDDRHNVEEGKNQKSIERKKLIGEKTKKTFLRVNDSLYHIKNISEKEITITPLISNLHNNTIKGELYFLGKTKVLIVGKIIRKKENQTTIRLVTRLSKKWIHQYHSENLKTDN